MSIILFLILGASLYSTSGSLIGCNSINKCNATVRGYRIQTDGCSCCDLCYIGTIYFEMNGTCFSNIDFTCSTREKFKNMNESQVMRTLQSDYVMNSSYPLYVFDDYQNSGCYTTYPSAQCNQNTGKIILFLALAVFCFWVVCESIALYNMYNKRKSYIPLLSSGSNSPHPDINF
jgi:hypothetical protein